MADGALGARAMLDSLPWPNAVGKRCLVLGRAATAVRAALEERRAGSVVIVAGDELDAQVAEPFDLVIGWGIATDASAPLERLQAVRRATRNLFVSIEPIDALLTVGARPLPLLRLATGGEDVHWTMNGRAHHRLLTAAGFTVEGGSRIVGVQDASASSVGLVERAIGRILTAGRPGVPHRALVARALP